MVAAFIRGKLIPAVHGFIAINKVIAYEAIGDQDAFLLVTNRIICRIILNVM
jgi:hypothetical protein